MTTIPVFLARLLIGVFVLPLTLVSALPAQADPPIAPITPPADGQTYGRWAAAWWQWALGIPAPENPFLDTTGANCAQRQVDQVWFLAGAFGTEAGGPYMQYPGWKVPFLSSHQSCLFCFS
jgi:hypothetical protein